MSGRARAALAAVVGSAAAALAVPAAGATVVSGAAPTGGTARGAASVPSFTLDAQVRPRRAYVAGRPVSVTLSIAAAGPLQRAALSGTGSISIDAGEPAP